MNLSSLLACRRTILAAAPVLVAAMAAPWAAAQSDFPSRPIKIIIGYPPGGSVDFVGRVVGEALGKHLQATIVIDNQGGAAGTIATQRTVGSPADGYTLLLGSSNELAGTGAINKVQKYDAQKDLYALGLVGTAPVLLVAGPEGKVKTTGELIDAARRMPGQFSYGSSGVGSSLHFAGELFKQKAGVFMTHIPYRGVAPLTSDLAGGNIELGVLSLNAALPFLQTGRLTALGVTSAKRLPSLPNVPALGEHPALKGYELVGWFSLMAPRKLPPEIAQKISQALQASLQEPDVRRKLDEMGIFAATGKEDLPALIRQETAKYIGLAEYANIRD